MQLPENLILPTTTVKLFNAAGMDSRQLRQRHDAALAFLEFHHGNLHVLDRFHRLAWRYLDTVRTDVVSLVHVANVIRWEEHLRTTSADFLINNNHISFYTRTLEQNDPGLEGRITKRVALPDDMVWHRLTPAGVAAEIARSRP